MIKSWLSLFRNSGAQKSRLSYFQKITLHACGQVGFFVLDYIKKKDFSGDRRQVLNNCQVPKALSVRRSQWSEDDKNSHFGMKFVG